MFDLRLQAEWHHETQSPYPKLHGWTSWHGQSTLRSNVATYHSKKDTSIKYDIYYLPEPKGKGNFSLGKAKFFTAQINLLVLIDHANPNLFSYYTLLWE